MIQGSIEWMQARLGNLTGSRMYEACGKKKNGEYYSTRSDLLSEKLLERLTGEWAEHFVTDAMQWGTDHEEEARSVYETRKGILVQECAYLPHPSIPHSGASPDGLVGKDGLIEIKCPSSHTHLDMILAGEIPPKYLYQMAWECECAGRQWADFVSYDPRLPGNLSFFCQRYTPDSIFIAGLRLQGLEFLVELNDMETTARNYSA